MHCGLGGLSPSVPDLQSPVRPLRRCERDHPKHDRGPVSSARSEQEERGLSPSVPDLQITAELFCILLNILCRVGSGYHLGASGATPRGTRRRWPRGVRSWRQTSRQETAQRKAARQCVRQSLRSRRSPSRSFLGFLSALPALRLRQNDTRKVHTQYVQ